MKRKVHIKTSRQFRHAHPIFWFFIFDFHKYNHSMENVNFPPPHPPQIFWIWVSTYPQIIPCGCTNSIFKVLSLSHDETTSILMVVTIYWRWLVCRSANWLTSPDAKGGVITPCKAYTCPNSQIGTAVFTYPTCLWFINQGDNWNLTTYEFVVNKCVIYLFHFNSN